MITITNDYINAAVGSESAILQDIHLKEKNIAIYRRNIEHLSTELNQLGGQEIEFRASGSYEEILVLLKELFDIQLSNCPQLLGDISQLIQLFKQTTKASSFRLFLASVRTDMCRKFHTDINDLRLLCTYTGPGTLWLPNEIVNYKALQSKTGDQEIVLDHQQVQQAATGDIVLLKGALYPEADPILHRSPPIKVNGQTRILLRIDTNEFLNYFS
ncbi:MAG: DUF1826 domain-containing protein [Bacteroidota bacterium]